MGPTSDNTPCAVSHQNSSSGESNSTSLRRRLLKRSKAVSMEKGDKILTFRNSLESLPETESTTDESVEVFPSLPDNLLKSVGLFDAPSAEDNKNLNEPDIEERFARLALAFKTDKFTLNKRLDLQKRQRDVAEKNIETELDSLRESLNTLHRIDQLYSEADMRDIITKMQQHVDIIQRATLRMSNKAETYGAIQQEERLNCAFETMLNYVEHLKLLYDKEHIELEEYRRLLAEHNLLPGCALDADDSKRALPPRSHSLSSSSKPEFLKRWSSFIRPQHSDVHQVITRENSSGHLVSSSGLNVNYIRQKLESRTRLLSSVCLLNASYESPRLASNGSSPGSEDSPKNRRCSLPAGPTLQHPSALPLRTHNSIHEIKEIKMERRESQTKSAENELEKTEEAKEEEDEDETDDAQKEKPSEETADDKDSSELNFSHLLPPEHAHASNTASSLQVPACDNDVEDICLLPEISIPIKPQPLYFINLIKWASTHRIWRLDSATIILHTRYTLSAMLATAAMLTFVLTFIPNHVLAYETGDSGRK